MQDEVHQTILVLCVMTIAVSMQCLLIHTTYIGTVNVKYAAVAVQRSVKPCNLIRKTKFAN